MKYTSEVAQSIIEDGEETARDWYGDNAVDEVKGNWVTKTRSEMLSEKYEKLGMEI